VCFRCLRNLKNSDGDGEPENHKRTRNYYDHGTTSTLLVFPPHISISEILLGDSLLITRRQPEPKNQGKIKGMKIWITSQIVNLKMVGVENVISAVVTTT
jgi:hypothetical protein